MHYRDRRFVKPKNEKSRGRDTQKVWEKWDLEYVKNPKNFERVDIFIFYFQLQLQFKRILFYIRKVRSENECYVMYTTSV